MPQATIAGINYLDQLQETASIYYIYLLIIVVNSGVISVSLEFTEWKKDPRGEECKLAAKWLRTLSYSIS